MLQLILNSEFLDVPSNIEIPITATNPLFSESGFNEAFTYSFNVPASPKNVAIYNRHARKNPVLSITFFGHRIFTGKVEMKKDSSGINIMAKSDGIDLRQQLEALQFSDIEWPTIKIWETSDDLQDRVDKWKAYMDATLPQNQAVNQGMVKFPPISAYPRAQWSAEEKNGRAINQGMDLNRWTLNRYSLESGEYVANEPVQLPVQEISFLRTQAASTLSGGEYFTINSANDERKYYVWYQTKFGPNTPVGTDPALTGRIGARVVVDTLANAEQVMLDTMGAMFDAAFNSGNEDFEFFNFPTDPTNEIFIRNNKGGATTNADDGTLPNTWDVSTFQEGTGSISDFNNNWQTSVSPCPRFDYLLSKILQELKVVLSQNELLQIQEYTQLIFYSGKSLDERVNDDNFQWNVFGQNLSIFEFVPDGSTIQLFQILRTIFGVSFNFANGKLTIQRFRLNNQVRNMSKFCAPDYQENITDAQSWFLNYGISDETEFLDQVNNEVVNRFLPRQIGHEKKRMDITPNYLPMISQNAEPTTFFVPELAKSRAYSTDDFTVSKTNWIGFYRGNREMNFILPFTTTELTDDRLVCFSGIKVAENTTSQNQTIVNVEGNLGTCSLYFSDDESHIDVYAKPLIIANRYTGEVEKVMQLPLSEVLELMKWKTAWHVIQQRNMSFKGIAKELTFTLRKSSISFSTVTYAVDRSAKDGDFNDDFNNDYQ